MLHVYSNIWYANLNDKISWRLSSSCFHYIDRSMEQNMPLIYKERHAYCRQTAIKGDN
jgi:hypothetical protein